MRDLKMAVWLAAGALLWSAPIFAQNENAGQGRAVITVLPKHDGDASVTVAQPALKLEINGKESTVTGWKSLQGPGDGLEVVVLIDSAARSSLGSQFEEIGHFIQRLPPNARAAIAYMQNGQAVFSSPLSEDRAQILKGLHLPIGGSGVSASPYFCLSDLAKRWPSQDRNARREVVMISDGVDSYSPRYDPDDPYVQQAIADSVRAGLIVYALYWKNHGIADNSQWANNAGQNLLVMLADATGGNSYWEGFGDPVSFEPYFDDLNRRFRNQYELGFTTRLYGKPQVENLKLKLSVPNSKVDSPQKVFVYREGAVAEQ
jgi:hypothetical protein